MTIFLLIILIAIIIFLHLKEEELIVATKQEVLDAIQAEHEQVLAAVSDFNAQIQALKDQIANGQAATPEDLDEIAAKINDIFVP